MTRFGRRPEQGPMTDQEALMFERERAYEMERLKKVGYPAFLFEKTSWCKLHLERGKRYLEWKESREARAAEADALFGL